MTPPFTLRSALLLDISHKPLEYHPQNRYWGCPACGRCDGDEPNHKRHAMAHRSGEYHPGNRAARGD